MEAPGFLVVYVGSRQAARCVKRVKSYVATRLVPIKQGAEGGRRSTPTPLDTDRAANVAAVLNDLSVYSHHGHPAASPADRRGDKSDKVLRQLSPDVCCCLLLVVVACCFLLLLVDGIVVRVCVLIKC